MGSPDQWSPDSAAESNLAKMTERAAITQVVVSKPFSMLRFIQTMQAAAMRSCTRACQLFCLPVGEKSACSSARPLHPEEESHTQDPLLRPPSTVLIINISNSTLIDCVIGDSQPSTAAEQQALMQETQPQGAAPVNCGCCQRRQELSTPRRPPGEHVNITIQSSSLNSVIIGDNNHMDVQQIRPAD